MDNEIVSLPVKENDERAIAQTQGKPTDHKTDSNNESMDEDNYVSQNPTLTFTMWEAISLFIQLSAMD